MHSTQAAHALRCLLLCLGLGLTATAAPRRLVVAQDGSGDHETIAAAVAAADGATEADPIDIIIKPGTYVETLTTRHWVNLIGEDRDGCIVSYEGDGQETHRKHTIWATSNTRLQNLTILGTRVKYCIHSDGGGAYVLTIENCILRRVYREGIRERYVAAFGIGLHARQHIVMHDCRLEADLPIYLHNWDKQAAPCSMTLERCTLEGKDHALIVSCLGSGQADFLVLHDCVLTAQQEILRYTNMERSERIRWQGTSEIAVFGSGNRLHGPAGHPIADDADDRRSGLDRAGSAGAAPVPAPAAGAAAKVGVRLEEVYGTAPGRTAEPAFWRPVKAPGKYALDVSVLEQALELACPATAPNAAAFGYAGGPAGNLIAFPFMLEMRLRGTYAAKGQFTLYCCSAPAGWAVTWFPDRVRNAHGNSPGIAVDTTEWHTVRLVAKSRDDVRLFVDGTEGDGIALTAFEHSATYLQFRVHGPGTRAEIESSRLTGLALPPAEAADTR